MPLTALASRYRRTPYDDSDYPPGVLSPFEDDSSPALDPSYYDNAEAQGQTASDPQPQQQPLPTSPTPPDTTASAGLETLPPLNPAQPANGNYSGLRKLTTMPAPGSAAPVPATTQAPQAPSAAAPAPGADTQATIGQLNTLQKPDAPTSNWAQRLGMAILSMTKLAPVANQIIHPKWSQQEGAYEAQKGDIESRLKDQEGAENTLTLAQQRQAKALELTTQNVPHKNQQQIDPAYAKENLPFLIPDANGQYWVDKELANTLTKPDAAAKVTLVPEGGTAIDSSGKILYQAPAKPDKPPKTLGDETRVAAIAAGLDPDDPSKWTPSQAQQVQQDIEKHRIAERPPRAPSGIDDKLAVDNAIRQAYNQAGGDWNKVLAGAHNMQYGNFNSDIADHAQKMTALPPDAQRKVAAADTTLDQVNQAINAIDEVTKAHPDLVGPVTQHPINALTRKIETMAGSEPPDVGATDAILETAAALQPGQHNFRSIGALSEFKKALGIDPRTGKADGSREWLRNPEKAKAALRQVADFNQRLKANTLSAVGKGSPVAPAASKPDPLGIR